MIDAVYSNVMSYASNISNQLSDHTIPFPIILIQTAVVQVAHLVDCKVELGQFADLIEQIDAET